jgi:cholesterol transport system auxiliary component
MTLITAPRLLHAHLAAALSVLALGACSALHPVPPAPANFYTLDSGNSIALAPAPAGAATLIVNPPHAAAGYDSSRILYVRSGHKLEYFANSQWVDPPARMLAPLLVAALAGSGAFRAVVLTPSAAAGDLRLDVEIVRLQQDFSAQPSNVRFTLRAYLVDDRSRAVLAWREFDASVPSVSEDPYGGVQAANLAVQKVLADVATFCVEVARKLPPGQG